MCEWIGNKMKGLRSIEVEDTRFVKYMPGMLAGCGKVERVKITIEGSKIHKDEIITVMQRLFSDQNLRELDVKFEEVTDNLINEINMLFHSTERTSSILFKHNKAVELNKILKFKNKKNFIEVSRLDNIPNDF